MQVPYKILHITLFLFLSQLVCSQKSINWLSWEEALELQAETNKKIFVDVYTDWCMWCKKLEGSTLSESFIVDYMNDNYISVKFDAEQKDDIIYNNKIYKQIKSFGRKPTHELAIEIMNGNVGYPTLVFIDENLKVIQPLPGFQDVKTFEMIMKYFAEDNYKKMPWKKFVANFQSDHFASPKPKDYQPHMHAVKNKNRP